MLHKKLFLVVCPDSDFHECTALVWASNRDFAVSNWRQYYTDFGDEEAFCAQYYDDQIRVFAIPTQMVEGEEQVIGLNHLELVEA